MPAERGFQRTREKLGPFVQVGQEVAGVRLYMYLYFSVYVCVFETQLA